MFASEMPLNILLPRRTWADWAGMIASIGCAIHCAAMPLVLVYLPTLGLSWLADEVFHKWMAVLCFGLAAAAFVPGWRSHRSFLPAIWAAAGLLLLTTAAFGLEGTCCASCSSDEPSAAMATAGGDCSTCQASETIAPTSASGIVLAWIPLLITPVGGLLLVVGHALNHMKKCKCRGSSCCLTDGDSRSTLERGSKGD
ncbi:MAG: MerC domain-containing protein [Pirellulaceae bacterium]|nr:MerC domain-containing protein [Pirellulaceae bacterium]